MQETWQKSHMQDFGGKREHEALGICSEGRCGGKRMWSWGSRWWGKGGGWVRGGGRLFHSHFLCLEIRRIMLLLGSGQGRGQRCTWDWEFSLVWISLQLCSAGGKDVHFINGETEAQKEEMTWPREALGFLHLLGWWLEIFRSIYTLLVNVNGHTGGLETLRWRGGVGVGEGRESVGSRG